MNQKCHTLQGSSTTACSLKILCGERANEFGRTQRETERRQKFLRTIFAFITLETTKVIGRVLPSTNHLLFYDGPCDLSLASSCFDDTQISVFSSKNSDIKSSAVCSPLISSSAATTLHFSVLLHVRGLTEEHQWVRHCRVGGKLNLVQPSRCQQTRRVYLIELHPSWPRQQQRQRIDQTVWDNRLRMN